MKVLAGILFSLLCSTAVAQHSEIQGLVLQNDKTIPFANITISGTGQGTSADLNGRFSIQLKEEKTELTIQAIGFKTRKISIDPKDYVR